MSLTQMTIDGNENIEIIPTEEENEGAGGSGSGDGTGEGDGTGSGGGAGGSGSGDGTGSGSGSGTGSGDGTGSGSGADGEGTGEGDGTGSGGGAGGSGGAEKRASVEIVEAEVGVNDIRAKFYLNDPDGKFKNNLDSLYVQITNVENGYAETKKLSELSTVQITEEQLEFNYYNEPSSPTIDFSCENVYDQFSVSNPDARLSAKIGLPTIMEMNALENAMLRRTGASYWTMSPSYFDVNAVNRSVANDGLVTEGNHYVRGARGIRPVISLKPGTLYDTDIGNGSMTDPYVVFISPV